MTSERDRENEKLNRIEDIRDRARALYKPPFRLEHGYIIDSSGRHVADQAGDDVKAMLRIRGWGRIGYLNDPEKLQDTVGELIAEALTKYWTEK